MVQFDDGFVQTVNLPSWATKDNIKDEAVRLRKQVEDREANKIMRSDLVDM